MNLPKKILISTSDIDFIYNEYKKKDRFGQAFTFCLGIIIPCWFTIFTLFKNEWGNGEVIYTTLTSTLTIVTVILGIIVYKNNKKMSFADEIKSIAEEDSAYTALFIIAKLHVDNNGNKRTKVLVQKKESWNCDFLPYWDLNKKEPLDKQYKTLCEGLASKLNIKSEDIRITHLENDGCYRIKVSVPEQKEKLFRHEFYLVTLSNYLKENLLNRCKWIDIDLLAEDINAVKVNSDVIDKLMLLKGRIPDSFDSSGFLKEPIKIIWNITNKCLFNCDICATHFEERIELSEPEKAKALLSILSIKDSIKELNFAGGDPLISSDSKKIIKFAMSIMDKNKITVTTTGKGIETLTDDEKICFLNNCVLSLDTYDFNDSGIRNSKDYNKLNSRNALRSQKFMSKLRINVPIISTDITDNEIKKLVYEINKIRPNEVSLIRLMPVGKQSVDSYPRKYRPERFINIFKKELDKNIQLHIHCSLRCKYGNNTDEKCTMLTKKIGIDCAGNVFACCWAGYIKCNLEENTFYLGNLLNNDLKEILDGYLAAELLDNVDRNKCGILDYLKIN